MKTHSLLARLVSLLALVATPACDINVNDSDGGDGDGMGSSSGDDGDESGDDDDPSGGDSDDSEDSDDPDGDDGSSSGADDPSGGDSDDPIGSDDGPDDGEWTYADDGASENDCSFLDATQGVGDFMVENHGDGTFTIVPGDGTDSFECDLSEGGKFDCPERYVETISEAGVDADLDVLVAVEGITSATEMDGEQRGRIVCEGADCSLAETFLGTSLPCAFVIPFSASR